MCFAVFETTVPQTWVPKARLCVQGLLYVCAFQVPLPCTRMGWCCSKTIEMTLQLLMFSSTTSTCCMVASLVWQQVQG